MNMDRVVVYYKGCDNITRHSPVVWEDLKNAYLTYIESKSTEPCAVQLFEASGGVCIIDLTSVSAINLITEDEYEQDWEWTREARERRKSIDPECANDD
jgi:hypothetical protein